MTILEQQREFILRYLENNLEASATNQDFHDEFWAKFGGARKETFWGAQPVRKAMQLLKQLATERLIVVRIIGIKNWQPGFPKWVRSYSRN